MSQKWYGTASADFFELVGHGDPPEDVEAVGLGEATPDGEEETPDWVDQDDDACDFIF
jgi:hypothetical protein